MVLVTYLLFLGEFNSYVTFVFIAYAVLYIFSGKLKIEVSSKVFAIIVVVLYGILMSFIYNPDLLLNLGDVFSIQSEGARDNTRQILLIRESIILGISMPLLEIYLRSKSYKELRFMFYFGFLLNVLFGFFQFAWNMEEGERLRLSFSEPSAAGYYMSVVLSVLLFIEGKKGTAILSAIMTLTLVRSKAFFMVFGALLSNMARSSMTKVSLLILVSLALVWSVSTLEIFEVIKNFYLVVIREGLILNTKMGLEETFVTRLSGIFIGSVCLVDNLLGVGIGNFHYFFLENYKEYGIYGKEISGVNTGEYYATPNSNLLEFFVINGVFSIIPLRLFFLHFRIFKFPIVFWVLIILSFILELNPWLYYLVFLSVYIEKHESYSGYSV